MFTIQRYAQLRAKVNSWLSRQHCTLVARVKEYDHLHYNELLNRSEANINTSTSDLKIKDSFWKITSDAAFVINQPNAVDVTVRYQMCKRHFKTWDCFHSLELCQLE